MIDFSCQDKTDELCFEARSIIEKASMILVGLGALGTSAAHALVRSGCKNLFLVDDDVIEASNLPRQSLYTEKDINKKKVVVSKERLLAINKDISIKISSVKITSETINILKGYTLILDCTDNLETRRLIDDFSFENNIPWVHAAVIRSMGEVIAFTKNSKRYNEFMKNKVSSADCKSAGILSTAAIITGTFQATIALRLLVDKESELINKLFRIDCWKATINTFSL